MIHGWCRAGVVIDEDATSSFLYLRRFRIGGLVLSIPSFHAFLQPSAASLAFPETPQPHTLPQPCVPTTLLHPCCRLSESHSIPSHSYLQ